MRVGRLARPFRLYAVLVAVLILAASGVQAQTLPHHALKAAFNPQETVLAGGQRLRLSGPLGCDQGTTLQIHLAVTQRSTDAAAVDQQWSGVCTGDPLQQWRQEVAALEGTAFAPGDAFACGVAVARDADGRIADVLQWCDSVTLAPEDAG